MKYDLTIPLNDIQKLKLLFDKSRKTLLKLTTVFPFDFFPDEISIDKFKVNIISHDFFLAEDVHSIPIDMIKDIDMYAGPFFATLKITPDGYPGHALEVNYLWRDQALKARRIIEGLIIAKKEKIDLINFDDSELGKELEEIGRTQLAE